MKAFENLKRETGKNEKCNLHNQLLIYYCTTCQKAICSDCAMFGSDHKEHKFEHLEKVYNQHVKSIKDESGFIKEQLMNYMKAMESIRRSIDSIQKAKEAKEEELVRVMETLRNNLEKQLKEKLVLLLSEKSAIGNEITYLETLTEAMEKEINAASKSQLVKRSKELTKIIGEAKKRPTISFDGFNCSPEFT